MRIDSIFSFLPFLIHFGHSEGNLIRLSSLSFKSSSRFCNEMWKANYNLMFSATDVSWFSKISHISSVAQLLVFKTREKLEKCVLQINYNIYMMATNTNQ